MTLDEHLAETWPVAERPTEAKPAPDDRLTALLYLLMRDHLPIGTLTSILADIEMEPGAYVLSNKPLAVLARDLAGKFR